MDLVWADLSTTERRFVDPRAKGAHGAVSGVGVEDDGGNEEPGSEGTTGQSEGGDGGVGDGVSGVAVPSPEVR